MCNICSAGLPHPVKPCLVAVLDRPEAAPTGRLHANDVARPHVARRLRGNRLTVHEAAPGLSRLAAARALRSPAAALPDERESARLEHAQIAHETVAAARAFTRQPLGARTCTGANAPPEAGTS